MAFVLALWLAVLTAFTTPRVAPLSGAGLARTVQRATNVGLDDTLRGARSIATVAAARGAPSGAGDAASPVVVVPPRARSIAVRGSNARALSESHVVAARGDVLPYFATAPPSSR